MKNSVCRITHLVNSGVRQLENECGAIVDPRPIVRPRNGGVASAYIVLAALVEGNSASRTAITMEMEVLRTPPIAGRPVNQPELCCFLQVRDHSDQEMSLVKVDKGRLLGDLRGLVLNCKESCIKWALLYLGFL